MVGAVGGEQILNLGDGCQFVGLVLHEFGHAIGFYHEHNRPDRDDKMEILWDNVKYGKKMKKWIMFRGFQAVQCVNAVS